MHPPYIALYPADFLADISSLGNTELGIYWRLLLVYYQTRQSLPQDRDKLIRIAMAFSPEEIRALDFVLAEYFVSGVDDSPDKNKVYRHTRADREIDAASSRWLAAHNRAKAGAEARWNAQAMLKHSSSNANYNQNYNHNQNPKKTLGEVSPSTPLTATRKKREPAVVPKSGLSWEAYASAFSERYGTEPVRNASVNAMLSKLVDRIGVEDSPQVARFYLSHNHPMYVTAGHAVSLLLRDCEKLRMEWATDHKITTQEAKSAETADNVRERIKRLTKEEK